MARRFTTHGKYKGVIVSTTDVKRLRRSMDIKRDAIMKMLVQTFMYIGQAAVKEAREMGNYNDITGNLRSSIGYIVLVDGRVMHRGVPEQTAGKDGDGSEGAQAGRNLLERLKGEYPNGVALVLCAGMEYAAYVENVRHKRVLIDGELVAQRLADELLGKIITDA